MFKAPAGKPLSTDTKAKDSHRSPLPENQCGPNIKWRQCVQTFKAREHAKFSFRARFYDGTRAAPQFAGLRREFVTGRQQCLLETLSDMHWRNCLTKRSRRTQYYAFYNGCLVCNATSLL